MVLKMMNDYRIKKITKGDKVTFRPQRKYLWWWIDLYWETFYDYAIHLINCDIQKRSKSMIEYLDVTPEKLEPRTPNPPPKNP